MAIYNHQAASLCSIWPDVWSDALQAYKKSMIILSLGVMKQHKTQTEINVLNDFEAVTVKSNTLNVILSDSKS